MSKWLKKFLPYTTVQQSFEVFVGVGLRGRRMRLNPVPSSCAIIASRFSIEAMKRLRIAGVVLVIVVAGTLWWGMRSNAAHTFTLPDGNHLYFRGATIGRNARM